MMFITLLTALLLQAPLEGPRSSEVSTIATSLNITVAWDANTEHVDGYYVYIGTSPSVYGERRDAGNVTQYTYNIAREGVRYYFAVSAYRKEPIVNVPELQPLGKPIIKK